ncbi:hypothetical protein B0I37DRAFT_237780 [Chaetomium sp. MPI-CAGE-AT-0009]|nr:hypothetical protein B0I37DRAFT_237780 [Chaetomium sp. MPI-CAGE-AT-0009]
MRCGTVRFVVFGAWLCVSGAPVPRSVVVWEVESRTRESGMCGVLVGRSRDISKNQRRGRDYGPDRLTVPARCGTGDLDRACFRVRRARFAGSRGCCQAWPSLSLGGGIKERVRVE